MHQNKPFDDKCKEIIHLKDSAILILKIVDPQNCSCGNLCNTSDNT